LLKITGMTCENCARRIRNALLKVPGVEEAEVDLNAGQARVSGGHPEIKALVEAVTEAGYAVLDAGA
jgi:copper chaperone CopZ